MFFFIAEFISSRTTEKERFQVVEFRGELVFWTIPMCDRLVNKGLQIAQGVEDSSWNETFTAYQWMEELGARSAATQKKWVYNQSFNQ